MNCCPGDQCSDPWDGGYLSNSNELKNLLIPDVQCMEEESQGTLHNGCRCLHFYPWGRCNLFGGRDTTEEKTPYPHLTTPHNTDLTPQQTTAPQQPHRPEEKPRDFTLISLNKTTEYWVYNVVYIWILKYPNCLDTCLLNQLSEMCLYTCAWCCPLKYIFWKCGFWVILKSQWLCNPEPNIDFIL